MKIMIVALALCTAGIGAFAVDQDQQSASFAFVGNTQTARQFTLVSPTGPRQFQIFKPLRLRTELEDSARANLDQQIRLSPGLLESSNNTCLKLRTYRVKRVDNTDATEPAGYATCLRGSQVQMKSAVGTKQTNRDSGGWH